MRYIASIVCAVFLLLPSLGVSYIPSTRLILNQTTSKHGKGAYHITQDLQFASTEGIVRVREQWWVKDGDEYRLEVTGLNERTRGLKVTYIYRGTQKLKGSRIAAEKMNRPMAEAFFHVRSWRELANLAKAIRALPEAATKPEPPPKTLEDVELKSNPYARLGRVDGVITYTFGSALWIEQDQFLIRQVRFADGVQISANDYSQYSRNLHFPKTRTFDWNGSHAEARLIAIRPIAVAEVDLNPKSLSESEQWPEDSRAAARLQGFYSRFR